MNTILICDDHPLMRAALALAIGERWPAARQTQADNYPTAWRLAGDQPDLMLVDLAMPGADALTGIARLKAAAPAARLIVVTGSNDRVQVAALTALGIDGLVTKTEDIDTIFAAIDSAVAGIAYLPAAPTAPVGRRPGAMLTGRQLDVVRLIAEGLSNKEVAKQLDISPATVKAHVAQIIAITGARNRTDAAMWAAERGLTA